MRRNGSGARDRSRRDTCYLVAQTSPSSGESLGMSHGIGNVVQVFDSVTGAQVTTITHPDLLWGLGINVRRR